MVHTRQKKYDTITHYLKTNGGSQVTLTFTQFDELLFPHSGLPKTAKTDVDWWANDYKHPEKGATSYHELPFNEKGAQANDI